MIPTPPISVLAILSLIGPPSETDLPGPETILKTLTPGHPRLLATAETFATIRTKVKAGDQPWSDWYAAVEKKADDFAKREPLTYRIPDGKRLLQVSRDAGKRIYPWALAYQVTGQQKYVDRAYQELEAIANFPDWNPSHFLDTAEMAHAVGIAYDWMYDAWSDEQRQVILDALDRYAFQPALKSYRDEARYGWWTTAAHNWNQVCNGGLTVAALAAADEQPETASQILAYAVRSLPRAMREYAPDGGYKESPGYWSYGTFYNVLMLSALETGLGTDFDLAEHPGFAVTGDFPIQLTGPTGLNFNFGDGSPSPISRLPALWWLGDRFERPLYLLKAKEAADRSPSALDLVWNRPLGDVDLSQLPLGNRWQGPHVVAMRSSWTDPKATFVAFKGGRPMDNHAQCDIGTFILEAQGVRWAIDLGRDNYNLPGYFNRGGGRWKFYRNRAEGHNTLVINPERGRDQDPEAVAKVVGTDFGGPETWAIVDMSEAYASEAQSVLRGVKLLVDQGVMIQDEIRGENLSIHWAMHTPAEVRLDPQGVSATLSLQDKTITALLVQPTDARFTTEPAGPSPNSPVVDGQKNDSQITKLKVVLENRDDPKLTVIFTDTEAEIPDLTSLEDWSKN